jgi:hypothetical protein
METRQHRRDELNGFQARLLVELTEVVEEHRRAQAATPAAGRRRRGRGWWARRRPLRAAAVALAALVGVGAVQLADVGPTEVRVGQGSVAAADVLRELADTTERQPAARPGPVRYTRTLERRLVVGKADGVRWTGHVQATVERWTRLSDGAYRERRSAVELTFPSPQDRAGHQRWVAAGSPNHDDIPANYWPVVVGLEPSDRTEGPGHVLPVTGEVLGLELADLPTDPVRLARVIRASQARRRYADGTQDAPIQQKMWAWLEEALWHPDASPRLQAAMLRVAATLQGVEVRRGVKDPAGRLGDAITFTYANEAVSRTTLIVDPRSAALLSRSSTLVDRRGRAWLRAVPLGEEHTETYLAAAGVRSLDQVP